MAQIYCFPDIMELRFSADFHNSWTYRRPMGGPTGCSIFMYCHSRCKREAAMHFFKPEHKFSSIESIDPLSNHMQQTVDKVHS